MTTHTIFGYLNFSRHCAFRLKKVFTFLDAFKNGESTVEIVKRCFQPANKERPSIKPVIL
jgi:hypothetical protein